MTRLRYQMRFVAEPPGQGRRDWIYVTDKGEVTHWFNYYKFLLETSDDKWTKERCKMYGATEQRKFLVKEPV